MDKAEMDRRSEEWGRDLREITIRVTARRFFLLPWPKKTFYMEKVTTRDRAAEACQMIVDRGGEAEIIGDEPAGEEK